MIKVLHDAGRIGDYKSGIRISADLVVVVTLEFIPELRGFLFAYAIHRYLHAPVLFSITT